ncbi:hypothetical protein [Lewinella sp. W8]|uniref:hypothetical protein n=1 Tax=Lewinella sp. W8 TaxID=2528208 RepID=UPI0012B62C2E|nr:hypothetical protein [Lewinella sp. W8]
MRFSFLLLLLSAYLGAQTPAFTSIGAKDQTHHETLHDLFLWNNQPRVLIEQELPEAFTQVMLFNISISAFLGFRFRRWLPLLLLHYQKIEAKEATFSFPHYISSTAPSSKRINRKYN